MGFFHLDAYKSDSAAEAPFSHVMPASIPNGSRLYLFATCAAAASRSYTPTLSGVTFTLLGSQASTGCSSFVWAAPIGSGASGATLTMPMTGGNLKSDFVIAIVDNPHGTSPDHLVLAADTGFVTSKTTPAGTTSIAGCLELQVVADCRASTLPQTAVMTAPASMSTSDRAFSGGTTTLVSIAGGYSPLILGSGAPVGGDVWTADTQAYGTAWTLAIRTSAAAGTTVYTSTRVTEVDASGSTGTATLTQLEGPTATVTQPTTGHFRIVHPSPLTDSMTFRLLADGQDPKIITVQADGGVGTRIRTYTGSVYV